MNFSTTEKRLKKVFKTVGSIKSLTIKMKPNPRAKSQKLMGGGDSSDSDSSDSDSDDDSSTTKKGGGKKEIPAMLSMGYGFVEFKLAADATKALKHLQGVEVSLFVAFYWNLPCF